jgi:hypothetical protein
LIQGFERLQHVADQCIQVFIRDAVPVRIRHQVFKSFREISPWIEDRLFKIGPTIQAADNFSRTCRDPGQGRPNDRYAGGGGMAGGAVGLKDQFSLLDQG